LAAEVDGLGEGVTHLSASFAGGKGAVDKEKVI
jgi:hypothetical protein